MLPPYELEKTEFRKAIKGYNTVDVKEHLDFIIDKYTELYRAYSELEQKYAETCAELVTYKNNEDAIRRALVYAQNNKKKILEDASRRSQIILRSAKDNCEKIISGFKEQIQREKNTLTILKAQVEQFKQKVFAEYQQHIEYLEEISPENDSSSDWILPDTRYAGKVLAQVMLDVERSEKESEASVQMRKLQEEENEVPFDETAFDTLISDIKIEDEIKARPGANEEPEIPESDPDFDRIRLEIERTIAMDRMKGSGQETEPDGSDPDIDAADTGVFDRNDFVKKRVPEKEPAPGAEEPDGTKEFEKPESGYGNNAYDHNSRTVAFERPMSTGFSQEDDRSQTRVISSEPIDKIYTPKPKAEKEEPASGDKPQSGNISFKFTDNK